MGVVVTSGVLDIDGSVLVGVLVEVGEGVILKGNTPIGNLSITLLFSPRFSYFLESTFIYLLHLSY